MKASSYVASINLSKYYLNVFYSRQTGLSSLSLGGPVFPGLGMIIPL